MPSISSPGDCSATAPRPPDRPGPAIAPWLRTTLLGLLVSCLPVAAANPANPAPAPTPPPPRHELRADAWWLLNLPEGRRLDASGLLRLPSGAWWTVNDQQPEVFEFTLPESGRNLDLSPVPDLLSPDQRAALPPHPRLDLEGLARDPQGRTLLCDEANRWILRWDPRTSNLERLEIDWSPVAHWFHPTDRNASFEGLAVMGDRLFVANERQSGRLIEIHLPTLQVVDSFTVAPSGSLDPDTHFSDLHAFDGSLWALLRDVRKILRIDPHTRQVLTEFDYERVEIASAVAYGSFIAPGFMEGLVVDAEAIWLLTDNNGLTRRSQASDTRPTLFRCPRPDLAPDHPTSTP